MDDEDRFSASSPESEQQNEPEQDEVMQDAEENDNDAEQDDDNNDDDDENNDDDNDGNEGNDGEDGADETQNTANADANGDEPSGAKSSKSSKSSTPAPTAAELRLRPSIRPEAITARLYDIVPTMAAPQSTSVNAMAITPDLRYWFTGGSDGYIRKYDGPGTLNGKLALTVAQKHPFVDSVTKAGILMSYWENDEPAVAGRSDTEHILSPVYSLAVHSEALWLLSGLESGGINLQSVRHDEGKKITCLQQHSNAVSALTLAPDEKSVLSGGWDKNIFDWDLNTGQTTRSFDGSGGQISSIELRPASGDPVPAEADEPLQSTTISTNNAAPLTNGALKDESGGQNGSGGDEFGTSGQDGEASPAHESLFGGSDAESLFGETAGEQPFGNDDDGYGGSMDMVPSHGGDMDHSADFAMTDMEAAKETEATNDSAPTTQTEKQPETQPQPSQDAMDVDADTTITQATETATVPEPSQPAAKDSPPKTDDAAADKKPDESQPEQPITDEEAKQMDELAEDKSQLKRSQSPGITLTQQTSQQFDQSQASATTFLSSAMDGTIRIWDRRTQNAVARIGTRQGVPPWCMSACWSPNGNMIYAGRRNGTVEEFDVRKAKRGWEPERTLKFPAGSGPVSAVKSMANGRHLVCASHDILRLYDLRDTRSLKHSTVPFLIVPGPPRAGVISSLYIDPTSTFMLSAAGTRGWDGTSTEVLIGYEINVVD